MGEKKQKSESGPEEIIAAFDRERDQAHELHRRHVELVRSSRANDRPAHSDRSRSQ